MRYNTVTIAGRLVRDGELKYTPSGAALLKMRLAYDQGTKEAPQAGFIDVTIFGKRAEAIHTWCTKGRQVLAGGRLDYREWDDQAGVRRSAHELVAYEFEFCDSRPTIDPAADASPTGSTLPSSGTQSPGPKW